MGGTNKVNVILLVVAPVVLSLCPSVAHRPRFEQSVSGYIEDSYFNVSDSDVFRERSVTNYDDVLSYVSIFAIKLFPY